MSSTDRLPKATHLPLLVENLRTAARWIDEHGAQAINASTVRDLAASDERSPSSPPTGTGDDLGGPGGGAPRSSTERDALANDWLADHQLALRALLSWLETNATDTVDAINEILKRVDPALTAPDKRDLLESACCEPRCEDPARRPAHSGRCTECRDWRTAWSEAHAGEPAPPVPESVITARLAARVEAAKGKQRRVYVTGPHAGELA